MIYPTKKDRWLVLIVIGCWLYLLLMTVVLALTRGLRAETWTVLITCIFYMGVIRLLAYPVYYEITPSEIIIKSGLLLRYVIPAQSIIRVSPTRNPLSSPAWSLDRLKIEYSRNSRTRYILISPGDKKGFLKEIKMFAPGCEIREG